MTTRFSFLVAALLFFNQVSYPFAGCAVWRIREVTECVDYFHPDWGIVTGCEIRRSTTCLIHNPDGNGSDDGSNEPIRCSPGTNTMGQRPTASLDIANSYMENISTGQKASPIPSRGRWGNIFKLEGSIDRNNNNVRDATVVYQGPFGRRRVSRVGTTTFSATVNTEMDARTSGSFSPVLEAKVSKPFCQNFDIMTLSLDLDVNMEKHGPQYELDYMGDWWGPDGATFITHHQSACPNPYSQQYSYTSTSSLSHSLSVGSDLFRFVSSRLRQETQTITNNYQFAAGTYNAISFEYDWLGNKHIIQSSTVQHVFPKHKQYSNSCN